MDSSVNAYVEGLYALRDRLRKDLGRVERMIAAGELPKPKATKETEPSKPSRKSPAKATKPKIHVSSETKARVREYLLKKVEPQTPKEIGAALGMQDDTARSACMALQADGDIRYAGLRKGGRGTKPKQWASWPQNGKVDERIPIEVTA